LLVSVRGWLPGLTREIVLVVWEGSGDVPGGGAGGEAKEKKSLIIIVSKQNLRTLFEFLVES